VTSGEPRLQGAAVPAANLQHPFGLSFPVQVEHRRELGRNLQNLEPHATASRVQRSSVNCGLARVGGDHVVRPVDGAVVEDVLVVVWVELGALMPLGTLGLYVRRPIGVVQDLGVDMADLSESLRGDVEMLERVVNHARSAAEHAELGPPRRETPTQLVDGVNVALPGFSGAGEEERQIEHVSVRFSDDVARIERPQFVGVQQQEPVVRAEILVCHIEERLPPPVFRVAGVADVAVGEVTRALRWSTQIRSELAAVAASVQHVEPVDVFGVLRQGALEDVVLVRDHQQPEHHAVTRCENARGRPAAARSSSRRRK